MVTAIGKAWTFTLVDAWMRRPPGLRVAVPVFMLATLCVGVDDAVSAVIPVTTTEQKINGVGGCSLQEAIYSANFDSNLAISRYDGSTPVVILTECEPGSGDDIIVLPAGAVFELGRIVDDADNPTGPTATPLITSNITILAHGATLQRIGSRNVRLFAVGGTGHLTIRRAYIKGFLTRGGDGNDGGGGGLGAGGAIYVLGGELVIEASTFDANAAYGGTGGVGTAGGGGGMGGHGGSSEYCVGGGGGGGARGNGGRCGGIDPYEGGGGGGTVSSAFVDGTHQPFTRGGFDCGGNGGHGGGGQSAPCPGGGGGGAGDTIFRLPGEDGSDGGRGNYGGGGGGGTERGVGGRGGFGGGGGASGRAGAFGEDGGNGGFGGGGGGGASGFITDGDGGNGGFFAGDGGDSGGGGGGAGLGGAIFNDSGSVVIRNSTFVANITGGGFSEKSQDGVTGGGAIFSRNGHLTVLNTTISGNLAHIGGGILVAQDSETAPTSFVLQNTIVADNGAKECAITGFTIGAAFAGNLIMSNADGSKLDNRTFIGCEGVVTSSDPQLGPLQYNAGPTPTMAIGSTSPAWNAADPGTSLPIDQRRQDRPAMGGFDIGAFELCLEGFGKLERPCLILAGVDESGHPDQTVALTIHVNPLGGGTTIPAPGSQEVLENSVIALHAIPNAGFRFTGWSLNVTNPGDPSTTVFMNASQTVTANFAACSCATDVTGSISVVRGSYVLNPVTRRYAQTVTLTNTSATTIGGPISLVLDDLASTATLYNATGVTQDVLPAGRPYINANTSLAPGQRASITLQFTAANTGAISYDTQVLAGPGSR